MLDLDLTFRAFGQQETLKQSVHLVYSSLEGHFKLRPKYHIGALTYLAG